MKQYGSVNNKVDRAFIEGFAKEHIDPNAHVMSDGANFYDNFGRIFRIHTKVIHSDKKSPLRWADGITNTNTIEGFWSITKKGILITYHSVTNKYIDLYCNEYAYRYNNRGTHHIDMMKELIENGEVKITKKDIRNRKSLLMLQDAQQNSLAA